MLARLAGALDAMGGVQGEGSTTQPYRPHSGGLILLSLFAGPLAQLTPPRLTSAVDTVTGYHALPGFLNAWLPGGVTRSDTAVATLAAGLLVAIALLPQRQDLRSAVLNTYPDDRRLPRWVLLLTLLPALSTITVPCAPSTMGMRRDDLPVRNKGHGRPRRVLLAARGP